MSVRAAVLGAALIGGICLVAQLFLDVVALEHVGLGLLAVAVALVGARLVRQPWMALITAGGSVALAWAVLEMARAAGPDPEVEAVVGGLATLCVALASMRSPERPGNHRT